MDYKDTEQLYEHLSKYVSENVWRYEDRAQLALEVIGIDRCPLQLADRKLYNDMCKAVFDYIEDNALDIDPDDIDIETILFT